MTDLANYNPKQIGEALANIIRRISSRDADTSETVINMLIAVCEGVDPDDAEVINWVDSIALFALHSLFTARIAEVMDMIRTERKSGNYRAHIESIKKDILLGDTIRLRDGGDDAWEVLEVRICTKHSNLEPVRPHPSYFITLANGTPHVMCGHEVVKAASNSDDS